MTNRLRTWSPLRWALLLLALLVVLAYGLPAAASGGGLQSAIGADSGHGHGNGKGEDDEEDDEEEDEKDDEEDDEEDEEDDGHGGGNGGNGGAPPGRAGSLIKFDQRVFTVREDAGEVVIGVERSKGEDGAVTVAYRSADGTATAGEDYLAVAGELHWPDGDGERKTFLLPVLEDDAFEVRETVELVLEVLSGNAQLHPGKGRAVLKIMDASQDNPGKTDADAPGRLEFARDDFQALEGDGAARVTVVRHHGSRGAVSVVASTSDDGATAGEDYTATETILAWGDGESGARHFEVPILQDDLEEGNEGVRLHLADATGGAEIDDEDGVADLLIVDDDGETAACVEDGDTLCLADDRFRVEVVWRTQDGASGAGQVEPLGDRSGLVWFFNRDNKEMLVKVLDACAAFDTYWVFFAALTNVDFTLTVTDTASGVVKEYSNPAGQAAEPVQDTFTFTTCGL